MLWRDRRGRKGLAGQWKLYRAPWLFRHFCFGSYPSCLKTNLPSRLWACLEGITPASSVLQCVPLPACSLAVWWHLWLHPFLFFAISTKCYVMHLFSTCDSIRYLVSGFFHPLCFDNSLPSVWKGQGGISSFRCCSSHVVEFLPLQLFHLQPGRLQAEISGSPSTEISFNDSLFNAHVTSGDRMFCFKTK